MSRFSRQRPLFIASAALFLFLIFSPAVLWGQDIPVPAYQPHGFTAFEEFRGVDSNEGQFLILDTSVGYYFNQHIALDIGVPVFFVRATVPNIAHDWKINMGDPYGDVRLMFPNRILDYDTVFTVTVPVHGTGLLSTGRVGLDWFNHFEHPIGRFTPFVNGGISNGILDTSQVSQPFRLVENFKTLGFIGDAEGGMTFRVVRDVKIGGSYYALLPAGDQKVYINGVQDLFLLPANVGPTDITHDRGYTAFVRTSLGHSLYAEAAYVHSIPLNEDAATVTIGVDLRSLLGRARAMSH